MRVVLIVSVLATIWPVPLLPQTKVPKIAAKPPAGSSKVSTSDAPISGRPPAVFWKRDFSAKPLRVLEGSREARQAVAAAGSEAELAEQEDTKTDVFRPIAPEHPAPGATASRSPPRLPPNLTRQQMLTNLADLRAGTTRSQVIAKLGPPAYSIGMDEGGHYLERCRFRSGAETIATVEFRDGLVAAIDKTSR